MNVWPLTSTSVAPVCWAIVVAISLVSCSARAVFRILALIILFFLSCFSISSSSEVDVPLLPIQIVGVSSQSFLFMNRIFPAVSLLIVLTFLFLV